MSAAYRQDGRAVDAASFYAVACDPRRSATVEACAGAGKTWMLVSRILRALIDGAEPSQILAITFTRKAAGEMRQRLDDWLAFFAMPMADDQARTQALMERGLGPTEARALAPSLGSLQGQVLAQARRVEIRTFHGWFSQLLAQAPMGQLHSMGLAPGLTLIENTELLRDELYRAFHRRVDGDQSLRAAYMDLVCRHRRHAVQRWLDSAWQRRTEIEVAAQAGVLDRGVPPASEVFADCLPGRHPIESMRDPAWRAELQALATELAARAKSLSDQAAARLRKALDATEPALALDLAWKALLTDTGSARQKMGDLPSQQAAVDRLMALRERADQQDAHEDHLRMVRLSLVLLDEYRELKQRRGLADMGDLESVALALLVNGELSAWVQSRLGQRLRHLLIDEFQDTSPLQWQALQGWLSGYAGAGAGAGLSVFIVGDPKQSIYRFRRAEPRVFSAARDFVTEALHGAVLECDHTRRNAPQIVDALNGVFSTAAESDAWDGFRLHSTESTAVGTVRCLPLLARQSDPARKGTDSTPGEGAHWRDSLTMARHSEEAVRRMPEARQVVAAIGDLLTQGVPADEIMVLARRRSALALVAQAMDERCLPFTMPEALSLESSAEAQDLLAVLDVLASPGHDLSLARALRSPVFRASDEDLMVLAERAPLAGSWWQALMSSDPAVLGSPPLLRAQGLLGEWALAAAELPPHDLLDRIVHEGDVMVRLAAALPARLRRAAARAVEALLAASLEVDGGRYVTPYRFVRSLRRDDVQARLPAPADAVRLLTVHGAKGLEARWVFVIDAHPQARAPERATLLVDWPPEQSAPRQVAFVAREGAIVSSLRDLLAQEQEARGREELNGLYVAMTRAEEGLVFSATAPLRSDPRSWWARVEPFATPWTPQDSSGSTGEESEVMVPRLPPLARRSSPDTHKASCADSGDSAGMRLGRAVHRLLEWIGRPSAMMPREQWAGAADAAAREFGLAPQSSEILAVAGRILDNPALGRFFAGADLRWAGNELPMAAGGQSLRLDRLVLLERGGHRHWWVLDYKLSGRPQDDPVNRAQLIGYMAAVRQAQPQDRVSGGFITGQGQLIEVDR